MPVRADGDAGAEHGAFEFFRLQKAGDGELDVSLARGIGEFGFQPVVALGDAPEG